MAYKRELKDDLGVMHTAYAVALIVGSENITECFYDLAVHESWKGPIPLIKLLFSVILTMTTLRFFWAPGNVERFIHRNKHRIDHARRAVVSVHFFVLLAHAFILYILAKYTLQLKDGADLGQSVPFLVFGYIGLLILNCGWLSVLVYGQQDKQPEIIWIRNNGLTAVAVAAVFLLVARSDIFIAFLLVVPIFLLNSLIDLSRTASSYISPDKEDGEVRPEPHKVLHLAESGNPSPNPAAT